MPSAARAMWIPNADRATVERAKVEDYLLSTEHPSGRHKAAAFLRFGFRPERWEEFAEAARIHANSYEAASVKEIPNGVQYVVEGALPSPDGRNPYVRTVWVVGKDNSAPRLVTAYPRRRRNAQGT